MKYLDRSLQPRDIRPSVCPDEFLAWLQNVRENSDA